MGIKNSLSRKKGYVRFPGLMAFLLKILIFIVNCTDFDVFNIALKLFILITEVFLESPRILRTSSCSQPFMEVN